MIKSESLKRKVIFLKSNLFLALTKFHRKPQRIMVDVNDNCNSRCITCYIWKNKKKENLPKEHIFRFVDQVFEISGPQIVTLAGGEPLMRQDIYEIISYINSKKGYPKIITNGLLLTKKTIDKLAESKISSICVSINGINPETHDYSRGIKGNLERIFSAVDYIKDNYPNIRIDFNYIIFEQNIDEIIPTLEYAKSVGAGINFQPISPVCNSSVEKSSPNMAEEAFERLLPKDLNKLKKIFEEIKKYRAKGHKVYLYGSYVGYYLNYFKDPKNFHNDFKISFSNIILKYNGEVKINFTFPPIGNIKNSSLKKLLSGEEAKRQRREFYHNKNIRVVLCNLAPTILDIFKTGFYLMKHKL